MIADTKKVGQEACTIVQLGFTRNQVLESSQQILLATGVHVDSVLILPDNNVRQVCKEVMKKEISAHQLVSLMGYLSACIPAVIPAPLIVNFWSLVQIFLVQTGTIRKIWTSDEN